MTKSLEDMSLEELWELFPIFLTEHRAEWDKWYVDERNFLLKHLPNERILRINHAGSTSIPNIWAKPIVDIYLEVQTADDVKIISDLIKQNGYTCMAEVPRFHRIDFNKGYKIHGFANRVFHLHLRLVGDNSELYFRDYLIDHPEIAKQYESLKMKLWKQFENNRDAYTNYKGEFISKYTALAKSFYLNRYSN